jgi:hypothetical protein
MARTSTQDDSVRPPATSLPAWTADAHVHARTCWWDVTSARWVCPTPAPTCQPGSSL